MARLCEVAFVFCLLAAPAAAQDGDRPNVLFILTEDQGLHMGAFDTKGVRTPAMDSLAGEGVLFTRAYVNYPICSASKGCIYTGLYPHTNGIRHNTWNHFKPAEELTEQDRAIPPGVVHKTAATYHFVMFGVVSLPGRSSRPGAGVNALVRLRLRLRRDGAPRCALRPHEQAS